MKPKLKQAMKNVLQQSHLIKKAQKKQAAVIKKRTAPFKKNSQRPQSPRHRYTVEDTILLVGEGNFSFARSLVESVLCTGHNVIATTLDSEAIMTEKYGQEALSNVKAIQECGGSVMFDFDATQMKKYKAIKKKLFNKIVFNFPHCGAGIKDQEHNIQTNKKLILAFLQSAANFLTSPTCTFSTSASSQENTPAPPKQLSTQQRGEIHITVKTGEPYDAWQVKTLAKMTGRLASFTAFPFHPEWFPGYAHRRTIGFKEGLSSSQNEEIVGKRCKTYVFVLNQE